MRISTRILSGLAALVVSVALVPVAVTAAIAAKPAPAPVCVGDSITLYEGSVGKNGPRPEAGAYATVSPGSSSGLLVVTEADGYLAQWLAIQGEAAAPIPSDGIVANPYPGKGASVKIKVCGLRLAEAQYHCEIFVTNTTVNSRSEPVVVDFSLMARGAQSSTPYYEDVAPGVAPGDTAVLGFNYGPVVVGTPVPYEVIWTYYDDNNQAVSGTETLGTISDPAAPPPGVSCTAL